MSDPQDQGGGLDLGEDPAKKKPVFKPVQDYIDTFEDDAKKKSWRRFFDMLESFYKKPMQLPFPANDELTDDIDTLMAACKFGHFLDMPGKMSITYGGTRDMEVTRTTAMMKKGGVMTEEKAYLLALLIYTSPQAQAAGATISGTDAEKAMLYDALQKVNALHPNGPHVRVNNFGLRRAAKAQQQQQQQQQQAPSGPLTEEEALQKLLAIDGMKEIFDDADLRQRILDETKKVMVDMGLPEAAVTNAVMYDYLATNSGMREAIITEARKAPDNTDPTDPGPDDKGGSTPPVDDELAKSFQNPAEETSSSSTADTQAAFKEATYTDKTPTTPATGITEVMMDKARAYVTLHQDSTQKGLRHALDIGAGRARTILERLQQEGVVGAKPESNFSQRPVYSKPRDAFLKAAQDPNSGDKYAIAREMWAKGPRSRDPAPKHA